MAGTSRHRRATDSPPLSDVVTKGNLDDRLEIVRQWQHDHEELAKERWTNHKEVHAVVEQSLRDYKRDANEWRQTLADLRTTFIPKAEYAAEHRALEAKLHGEVEKLAAQFSTLDVRVDANSLDIRTMNTNQEARRGLFSDTRSIVLLVIAIAGFGLVMFDRFAK